MKLTIILILTIMILCCGSTYQRRGPAIKHKIYRSIVPAVAILMLGQ